MKNSLRASCLALVLSIAIPTLALAHSAIEPVPRTDGWWQDRHKNFNKRVAEVGKNAQVLFIGDSITQGWEGEGKAVWSRYYAHRNAVNLGIGGDRTQHVLWRLENGNLDGLAPKAAVLMIGTNNSNGEDNTPGQIADGVAAIVAKLQKSLPNTQVLLLPIFPRGENFNAQRGKLLQINQVLQKLVDDSKVHWVDFGHRFVTSEGLIPRDLMPDYLHLSPKGYQIWAEALEPKLAAVLGDSPVKPETASASTTADDISGDWIITLNGPDGNPVSGPMALKQSTSGAKIQITGKIARGPDQWFQIENGARTGQDLSWTIKRDRPTGGTMTYQMSGKWSGDKIDGTAKTELDGNPLSVPWSAKRK